MHRQQKKKTQQIIVILLCFLLFLMLCVAGILIKHAVNGGVSQKSIDIIQQGGESAAGEAVYDASVYTKEYIDEKVKEIRLYYYSTMDNLSSLKTSEKNRCKYYTNSRGEVERIDFELYQIGYKASYYYHNNELYFAFVYKGKTENRFYIEDSKILRWITPEKETIDIGTADKKYSGWKDVIFSNNPL